MFRCPATRKVHPTAPLCHDGPAHSARPVRDERRPAPGPTADRLFALLGSDARESVPLAGAVTGVGHGDAVSGEVVGVGAVGGVVWGTAEAGTS